MLYYQISDLYRMEQAGLLNKPAFDLWLGIDSPTGYRWYNFTPSSFLECACAGEPEDDDEDVAEADWNFLTDFLWLGQIYE
jgi:hypothetical protein